MKKLSLLLATVFFLTACSNTERTGDMHNHDMNAKGSSKIAEGPIDPVCDMTKGDDWTEFTVTGSDTTWFCSPHCKKAFEKDPAKYAAK